MLSSALVIGMLVTGQFDASLPDLPDASIGEGGAETSQEMEDGHENSVCAANRDCERGFTCNGGKCRYVGYRIATQPSCLGAGGFVAAPMVLGWLWRRRRKA